MDSNQFSASLPCNLQGVSRTLLIPLWARAQETLRPDSIIRDPWAVRILQNMDVDLSSFSNGWKSQIGIAIRTWLLDQEIAHWQARNPEGNIVLLGGGLDARCWRLDNGMTRWTVIDLPEVIELRTALFPDSGFRFVQIACSVLEADWEKMVPANSPVLFIAEGLFMYLPQPQLKAWLCGLAQRYPCAELLFESVSPALVKYPKSHDLLRQFDTEFVWGISSGKELEAWSERLQFVQQWSYISLFPHRWRWIRYLRWLPALKATTQLHKFTFSD